MTPSTEESIVVCLSFPPLHAPEYIEALEAIDPRIEAVPLALDPGGDWMSLAPIDPHPEPPPWAETVASERDALLLRSEVIVALHTSNELMRRAPKLRWVHAVGAGVDQWVATGVSSDRVVVTNSSGMGAKSISEFVIGRLLQVCKQFRELEEAQQKHEWVRLASRTFGGTTLGIVGLGAIGEEVAKRAQVFGIRVLAMKRSYRPGMTSPLADQLFGPGDLHAMLGECDSVVVAAPQTPETTGMIDAAAIASMKKGAVLVNVARGPLVDDEALIDAMKSGHLGAAVLDVFDEEPLPATSPLWDLPNTYISPHTSVATDRYVEDSFELFAENLRRYVANEPLRNLVDMDALGFRKGE